MTTLKISDLSVGDWVGMDLAELNMPSDDLATAYIEELRKPIRIKGISEDSEMVLADIEEIDGRGSIMLKCEYLKPIPITPEILEVNGIHKTYECDEYAVYKGEGFSITEYYTDLWEFESRRNRVTIKRVHDLQHALRLVGIDKEINL